MKKISVSAPLLTICAVIGAVALLLGARVAGGQGPCIEGEPCPPSEAPRAVDPEERARLDLPVAEVGGVKMTVGDLESAIAKQSPLMRKELADPGKLREFLDKMLNMEVLAAEAASRGYDKDPEVISVLRNQLASLMHRRLADDISELQPTEEDLRAYYDANIDSYRKPARVRARHILISDEAKARELLKNVTSTKPSQYEFRRLAQENSEDETTRLRGGDLTFFTLPGERRDDDPDVPAPVAEAAFQIEENGAIYPKLVQSDAGYHVIMRTGWRDRMDLGFEETRERLVMLVQREKRKEAVERAIDDLQQRFSVDLSEENLKDVVIDLTGGPPEPHAPGGLTRSEKKKLEKSRKTLLRELELQRAARESN